MIDALCDSDSVFNKKWEYHVDGKYKKPTFKSSNAVRLRYIKAKYIDAAFVYQSDLKPLAPVFATDKSEEIMKKMIVPKYSGVVTFDEIAAINLPKAHLVLEGGCFVVFGNQNGQKEKTKVVKNNNSSKWTEQIILSVDPKRTVLIEIFHHDFIRGDELLCSAMLDVIKQCQNGNEVKYFDIAMEVDPKYAKQNKLPRLRFFGNYSKMS